jgi:hemoglobin
MATIYDELGGRDGVTVAVDIFYDHVLADDLLAPYFDGTDMRRQKRHLRAFLAAAVGGPDVYTGRDMDEAHAGLGITDEAFDRVVGHLVATLTGLGVAPATIAAIGDTLAPLRAGIVAA